MDLPDPCRPVEDRNSLSYCKYFYFIEKRLFIVPNEKEQHAQTQKNHEIETVPADISSNKVKFEIYGEEMIEKRVKLSGNSGRVYLPPNWVGHKVKIIRI